MLTSEQLRNAFCMVHEPLDEVVSSEWPVLERYGRMVEHFVLDHCEKVMSGGGTLGLSEAGPLSRFICPPALSIVGPRATTVRALRAVSIALRLSRSNTAMLLNCYLNRCEETKGLLQECAPLKALIDGTDI